tara:strand:- start:83 stop:727 length:645 start_codon:yes stop_codon:yes gene_type:complete
MCGPLRYIAIEGPIGVGKTTLARRLGTDIDAELLLEDANENPFLARFYREPRQYALAAQLFFLMQRANQIRALGQSDLFNPIRVADFTFHKESLFAELTLDPDELNLYHQLHGHVMVGVPIPDLVIYLQAPVEVLLQRISRRGIGYEQSITAQYLMQLTELYQKFFQSYEAGPLLIVDTSRIDLVNDENCYQALLEEVFHVRAGRNFLHLDTFL